MPSFKQIFLKPAAHYGLGAAVFDDSASDDSDSDENYHFVQRVTNFGRGVVSAPRARSHSAPASRSSRSQRLPSPQQLLRLAPREMVQPVSTPRLTGLQSAVAGPGILSARAISVVDTPPAVSEASNSGFAESTSETFSVAGTGLGPGILTVKERKSVSLTPAGTAYATKKERKKGRAATPVRRRYQLENAAGLVAGGEWLAQLAADHGVLRDGERRGVDVPLVGQSPLLPFVEQGPSISPPAVAAAVVGCHERGVSDLPSALGFPLAAAASERRNDCPSAIAAPMRAPGPSTRALRHRRTDASDAPPVEAVLRSSEATPGDVKATLREAGGPDYERKLRGRGGKHVRASPGPWLSAFFTLCPDLIPKSGPARVKAGLGDVEVDGEVIRQNELRRITCALVATLPWGCAQFILRDPPADIDSRPRLEVATRMVEALEQVSGPTSIDSALREWARLTAWCRVNRPGKLMITGSMMTDYFKECPPTTATDTGLRWLRDWCGVDLPVRSSLLVGLRGVKPAKSNCTAAGNLRTFLACESVAATHSSEFVRAYASGWSLLMRAAMRYEQSIGFVINAVVNHRFNGRCFPIVSGSVLRDKNPDRRKQRSRPVWFVVESLEGADVHVRNLESMLTHGEGVSRCVFRETNSADGSPSAATAWARGPLLDHTRAARALYDVLVAGGVPSDEANTFGLHFAKRFAMCAADGMKRFSDTERNEMGRFSGSLAQQPALVPTEDMLRRHSLKCAKLPDLYASDERVGTLLDTLCQWYEGVESASLRAKSNPRFLEEVWSSELWKWRPGELPLLLHAPDAGPQLALPEPVGEPTLTLWFPSE